MAATDAVRASAIARREVRASLERLEYHLGRGTKGVKGVQREIRFLDALHRRAVQAGATSIGASYNARALQSFGTRAAGTLGTGNSALIGRMKSSLLADFSADSLQPIRSNTTDPWVWTANASACPTCLDMHGYLSRRGETFTPMHPSCLCIPQDPASGVRPLTDREMVRMQAQYGDPRYASQMERFANGQLSREALRQAEAVNRTVRGGRAVAEHLAKREVTQTALGGSGAPAPPAPASPPAPVPEAVPPVTTPTPTEAVERVIGWSDDLKVGGRPPKGATEIIDDAVETLNSRLKEFPASIREQYREAFESVRTWHINASTEPTRIRGYWAQRSYIKGRKGRVNRELMLETRSHTNLEAWNGWVKAHNDEFDRIKGLYTYDIDKRKALLKEWKQANPRPKDVYYWSDPTEVASTLAHELTHVIAGEFTHGLPSSGSLQPGFEAATRALLRKTTKLFKGGDERYWYAAESTHEAVAEVGRMYLMGDGTLTASQWRAAYPDLVEWAETYLYPLVNAPV